MSSVIVVKDAAGKLVRYEARTLAQIGLLEKDLEQALAHEPGLLLLEEADIHYQRINIATQVSLVSPEGRRLQPDILAVTDNGEVVVVEVKRHGNPELKGRHVVAQVIDYAATLSTLDEAEQTKIFAEQRRGTLVESVAAAFPGKQRPELLAKTIAKRLKKGEVTLIIACDHEPPGLSEFVEAAASQTALGFTLRVVEITPYAADGQSGVVLWVPRSAIETEVIARTAVSITNDVGEDRIVVQITMDTAQQIQEAENERAQSGVRHSHAPSRGSFSITDGKLGLPEGTLFEESHQLALRACDEAWTDEVGRLSWPWETNEHRIDAQKTGAPRWGRQGINIGSSDWKPGLFLGVLSVGRDHRVTLLDPDGGVDLAVILNVERKVGKVGLRGADFVQQPEWHALRERLSQEAGRFKFVDHLFEVDKPNLWHPIHLRVPLVDVLMDVEDSPDARYEAMMTWLREGASLVLAGGELEALRERVLRAR